LCKLPQNHFIARCLQTPGVDQQHAVAFYQKFWRLRIDCRQQASRAIASNNVIAPFEPAKERDKTPFQSRIKPGMFVRLNPGAAKFEGITMVMIMSPATREDFAADGDERRFICALVGPSIMTDAYDLFVSKQDTFRVKDMAAEVLMEYDMATRYYYIDL
jgi:kinesin family protein 2/24